MLDILSQAILYPRSIAVLYRADMKTLGQRFRLMRKSKHLTQDQIAEICGITKSAVSQWEKDTTIPETQYLIKLREKIDFNLDWVLSEKGDMTHAIDQTRRKLMEVAQALPDYAVVRLTEEGTSFAELIEQASKPRIVNGSE